ncbi:MAG: glycoside hydrolase family 43 protein [Pirellulaceae bacterium]|nr:glycoside hydrolase family 43 protein [Pirellulaceae bacterium]
MKYGLILLALSLSYCWPASADEPIDIGSRRELFVDDYLIDSSKGVELRLQKPTPREIVLVHDDPWEGSGTGYFTVFRDRRIFRMYYKAWGLTNEDGTERSKRPVYACYAESTDGVQWKKPDLGLIEFQGSKHNNIVWTDLKADNFSVFKDTNPDCLPGEEYKALALGLGGLRAHKSHDGIRWSPLKTYPLITKGAFDSQNLAFWDPLRKHYWCYLRDFHNNIRDIRVSTSKDFITWTEPEMISYVDSPDEQLYTNQIQPYYRAPHIFVGFPTRYVERRWSPTYLSLPDPEHRHQRMKLQYRYGTAVTEGLFMTSRDGHTFNRWGEAFIRPGIERKHNWVYGDGYKCWGLIETQAADPLAPNELSFYAGENYWKTAVHLRRYTMRIDGFVALNAPLKGGDVVTKPIIFAGNSLSLNFSTSAAGSIHVEIQDASGKPISGYSLADCHEVFGDSLYRVVAWKTGSDLSKLAGRPIRLRFTMKDADLFSFQFSDADFVGHSRD